ncbi:uncharacterized protein [Amphiura filiformis]|uniref:uncharacterized protein n=1 Tax=Amphiura filiformis TaxID=82378 RepID=UPI003B222916
MSEIEEQNESVISQITYKGIERHQNSDNDDGTIQENKMKQVGEQENKKSVKLERNIDDEQMPQSKGQGNDKDQENQQKGDSDSELNEGDEQHGEKFKGKLERNSEDEQITESKGQQNDKHQQKDDFKDTSQYQIQMGQIYFGGQVIGQIYYGDEDDSEGEEDKQMLKKESPDKLNKVKQTRKPDRNQQQIVHGSQEEEGEEENYAFSPESDSEGDATEGYDFSPDSDSGGEKKQDEEHQGVKSKGKLERNTDGEQITQIKGQQNDKDQQKKGDVNRTRKSKSNREQQFDSDRDGSNKDCVSSDSERVVQMKKKRKKEEITEKQTDSEGEKTESYDFSPDSDSEAQKKKTQKKKTQKKGVKGKKVKQTGRKSMRSRKQMFYGDQEEESQEGDSFAPDSDSDTECEEGQEIQEKKIKKRANRSVKKEKKEKEPAQYISDINPAVRCAESQEQLPEKHSEGVKEKRRRKHIYGNRKTICEVCGKAFDHLYYKIHKKIHTEKRRRKHIYGNRKTICEVCGKAFDHLYYKIHKKIHTDKKKYICEICGKSYTVMGSLKYHKRLRHSSRRESYPCSVCGKQYVTKRYMRYHEVTAHKDVFPNADLKALQCDIKFNTNKKPRRYCSYEGCCRIFYNTPEQQAHEASQHRGEPVARFTCKTCGKQFSSTANMQRHMITHRPNPRPYACNYCSATFTQSCSRQAHERKHTGERPYGCSFCDKKFTQKSNQKTHEKRCKSRSEMRVPMNLAKQKVHRKRDKLQTKSEVRVQPRTQGEVHIPLISNTVRSEEHHHLPVLDIPLVTPHAVTHTTYESEFESMVSEYNQVHVRVLDDQAQMESESWRMKSEYVHL